MYKKIALLLLLSSYSSLLWAADISWAGQSDPLQYGVYTGYSATITTVGQAVLYVLGATDYKLAINYPASQALSIAARPIPPAAIQNKTMPIYAALLLLIGNDSRLVVDQRHQLITFETLPS